MLLSKYPLILVICISSKKSEGESELKPVGVTSVPRFLFVHVVHVCIYSHVHAHVCGGRRLLLGTSSVALHLLFWDRSLPEIGAYQLARQAGQEPAYFQRALEHPASCVGTGIWTQILRLMYGTITPIHWAMFPAPILTLNSSDGRITSLKPAGPLSSA